MALAGQKRQGASFSTAARCKRRAQGRDWASLPGDITNAMAERLLAVDVTDYMCFRAACARWRASTASPRDPTLWDVRFHPRGWVALCDGNGIRPADAWEITFFHTSTSRRLRVRLPELQDHRIVGFTDGLIILLNKSTTAVRVLHPFTRIFVDLTPIAPVFLLMVKNTLSWHMMEAAVCWSRSLFSISVVVWFPNVPVVVYTEPMLSRWFIIYRDLQLRAALPFQGRLFGIRSGTGQNVQVFPRHLQCPVVAQVPENFGWPQLYSCYLVDFEGDMLLTVQHGSTIDQCAVGWQPYAFAFFRADVRRRELVPVDGLGDRALFLSKHRCLCVSTKDLPSISRNSVYFTLANYDPVVLHSLSSQTFECTSTPSLIHDFKKRIRPSVRPFTLVDHLLTYCHLDHWTRGLMFHEYFGIPASWKKSLRQLNAHYSEIQVPCLSKEEKADERSRSTEIRISLSNTPRTFLSTLVTIDYQLAALNSDSFVEMEESLATAMVSDDKLL
ncbi:hypothetical protein QOZ80_6AG0538280 [Eleusine coracana subsp. coracana]|nr:hypothetical protein QOZ80_6AG0538280 [Eleusine coracana subsp. coracana]